MLKKLIRFFAVFALLVVIVFVLALRQAWRFWIDGVPAPEETELIVEVGSGFSDLADQLEEDGLIRSAFWFKVFAYLQGSASDLKAGTYLIDPSSSYAELIAQLVDGTIGHDIQVTIPEGYTVAQISELMVTNFDFTMAEWEAALMNDEGYLFPDTYRFAESSDPGEILTVLRETFDQKTADLEPYGGYTEKEWVIIASILEREVQDPADMAMVADIIYKRLDIGMALQMDSTVNYFTGKDTPSISFADRDIDHPYNTYLYPGLPPGPIANPGLAALQAAAQPEANDYYFFLTDPTGTAHYAVTYEEHLANKARYLD